MNRNGLGNSSSSSSTKKIKFNLEKPVRVTRIFIKEDHRLTKNDPIFTMVDADNPNSKKLPFLSSVSGTVTKLHIHEDDTLSHGSIILEYEECHHAIKFGNLCCDCGLQLNQLEDRLKTGSTKETHNDSHGESPVSGSPVVRPMATVSMEHTVPGLKVTAALAEKLCIEERDLLLRQRKLDLLVDLDQTVLHTTNSSHYFPYSSDVIAYQLNAQSSQTFYTKLRPGVKEFLTNLLPYYRFHIVTFGERLYAHTMARFIDPDKKFFYHRILSRNECLDPTRKTANLSALFPCGDSLVCIIDDREDVWNYARNLIHVKPYVWFKDVGDINSLHLPSPPIPNEQLIPPISEKEFEEQLGTSEQLAAERVEMESHALVERTTEEGYQMALHRGEKRKLDDEANEMMKNDESIKKLKEQELESNEKVAQNPVAVVSQDPNTVVDSDTYLVQLEGLLKRVHQEFYISYDQWVQDKTRDMPDLKQILPDIRRQVLREVSVCFSHLMPQGYPLEKHRATIIARAMGATVTADLQIDDNGHCLTTHVVAGKRTTKVERAIKYNIYVVTPEWLIDCYEQWERKQEENFILHQDYDVKRSRLFTKEAPRQAFNDLNNPNDRPASSRQRAPQPETTDRTPSEDPSRSSMKRTRPPDPVSSASSETIEEDEQVSKKEFNFSISVDELSDMEKEVNEFCNDDDDDDDDDEDSRPRPVIQQLTTSVPAGNEQEEQEYESDSSSSQKLRDLTLGEDRTIDSDEESLSDDDAPHGWKENPKPKQLRS